MIKGDKRFLVHNLGTNSGTYARKEIKELGLTSIDKEILINAFKKLGLYESVFIFA